MQEKIVTVSGKTYDLDRPFFVLATQNPIEQEGTYPLPEAQLDRFMLELRVAFDISEPKKLAWAFPKNGDTSLYDKAMIFF